MIVVMEGLPDNVLGVVVSGRVTKDDRTEVLMPALDHALQWHHRLRLYYEIRSRFPGAGWEEINLELERGPVWERVAIVTDVAWVRHAVTALRMLMATEIRVFAAVQTPEALAWITPALVPRVGAKPVASARSRRTKALPPMRSGDGRRRSFVPPVQYLNDAR